MARFPIVYDRATKATNGPAPGARLLMAWCLDHEPTATNLGIYNNRSVRGGNSLSTHAEGRALDIGLPATIGGTTPGWALAHLLAHHSADLGIQQLIYARKIWRNTAAQSGWRKYSGQSAHNEHIHCELTRQAANELTTQMIHDTIGDPMADNALETEIKHWQQWINDLGYEPPLEIDGDRGPVTNGARDTIAARWKTFETELDTRTKALDAARAQLAALEKQLDDAVSEAPPADRLTILKADRYDRLIALWHEGITGIEVA